MAQGKKYNPSEADKTKLQELLVTKGLNIMQAAEKLGICYNTFKKYRHYFDTTIKDSYELIDIKNLHETKRAYRKRIEGYKVIEKTYRTKVLDDGTEIEYLYEKREKEVLPDATLLMFDLVNKSNGEFVSINREPKKEIDLEVIQTIKELLTTPV